MGGGVGLGRKFEFEFNFIVVPSPTRIVEGQASASTREEIEVLRDHYGVNWLQVEYNFAFPHS